MVPNFIRATNLIPRKSIYSPRSSIHKAAQGSYNTDKTTIEPTQRFTGGRMAKAIPQLIDGEWRESRAREFIEVTDPATQEVLALAPKATAEEIEAAIASAKAAFLTWREVPVSDRARVMLRYQHLLKEHHDELAEILSGETGKTLADAKGDVWRGIEVVEQACNIASLIQPLGVCVGITPFNFPAMIPLWMFPLAIAAGNTFILKPSEQDPLTPNRLAELFID